MPGRAPGSPPDPFEDPFEDPVRTRVDSRGTVPDGWDLLTGGASEPASAGPARSSRKKTWLAILGFALLAVPLFYLVVNRGQTHDHAGSASQPPAHSTNHSDPE